MAKEYIHHDVTSAVSIETRNKKIQLKKNRFYAQIVSSFNS